MKILRDWTFHWWEAGLLKACLLSLGILLGLDFFDYLIGLIWLWWAIFAVTTIYFLIFFFKKA